MPSRESQMDAVTGISGSGPAYVFHMIECLIAAGIEQELRSEVSAKLATHTMLGADNLAVKQPDLGSVEQLRANVTSRTGTTAPGLEVLKEDKTVPMFLIKETVSAATARSHALGKPA